MNHTLLVAGCIGIVLAFGSVAVVGRHRGRLDSAMAFGLNGAGEVASILLVRLCGPVGTSPSTKMTLALAISLPLVAYVGVVVAIWRAGRAVVSENVPSRPK
jgi:hypothetical protein